MSFEIEAKLKVRSLPEIERRLGELGADFLAEQQQTDYHLDDANATLTTSDRCLRLRRQIVDGNESFFLTYKGAKEKSNLKKRQEVEIKVADVDAAEKLLSALGYEKVLVVEKERRLWQLGGCEVALDRLPLLGDFVEVEGPDEEKIAAVQNRLGLTDLPHITESYASQVAKRAERSIANRK